MGTFIYVLCTFCHFCFAYSHHVQNIFSVILLLLLLYTNGPRIFSSEYDDFTSFLYFNQIPCGPRECTCEIYNMHAPLGYELQITFFLFSLVDTVFILYSTVCRVKREILEDFTTIDLFFFKKIKPFPFIIFLSLYLRACSAV